MQDKIQQATQKIMIKGGLWKDKLVRVTRELLNVLTDRIILAVSLFILSFINLYVISAINNYSGDSGTDFKHISKSINDSQVISQDLETLKDRVTELDDSVQRVYVALFHNGVQAFGGTSFLKMTVTNEAANSDFITSYDIIRDIPLSVIFSVYSILDSNQCVVLPDVRMIDPKLSAFFNQRFADSATICPIKANSKEGVSYLAGIIVAEFSDRFHPENHPYKQEITEEIKRFSSRVRNFIEFS